MNNSNYIYYTVLEITPIINLQYLCGRYWLDIACQANMAPPTENRFMLYLSIAYFNTDPPSQVCRSKRTTASNTISSLRIYAQVTINLHINLLLLSIN